MRCDPEPFDSGILSRCWPYQIPNPNANCMSHVSETDRLRDGPAMLLAHLPAVESVIAAVCRRHHLRREDAEDFGADVKLKLVENDYGILRKFRGQCQIRTYLAVV